MKLNTLSPAPGSKKQAKRVGRGIGSGLGKTAGRGHKGQKSRSGGFHKVGFEGGQMPIHRRLPKRGFTSRSSFESASVRLSELALVEGSEINLQTLKDAGLINKNILKVKVYLSGDAPKTALSVDSSVKLTKGAKEALEKQGGKIK